MNNTSQMDILRDIVNEIFETNILAKRNKRENVDARKIFSKILSDRKFKRIDVGKYLRKHHSTIVHYVYEVDNLIKYEPMIAKKYVECKTAFENIIGNFDNEENLSIISLNKKIDELLLEKSNLVSKLNKYQRLESIMKLVDSRTPRGKEDYILRRISLMFNSITDYEKEFR